MLNGVSAKDIALSIQDSKNFIQELDVHPLVKHALGNITKRDIRNICYARSHDQLHSELNVIRLQLAPLEKLFAHYHSKNECEFYNKLCKWNAFEAKEDDINLAIQRCVENHIENADQSNKGSYFQFDLFERLSQIEFADIKIPMTTKFTPKTEADHLIYRHSVMA